MSILGGGQPYHRIAIALLICIAASVGSNFSAFQLQQLRPSSSESENDVRNNAPLENSSRQIVDLPEWREHPYIPNLIERYVYSVSVVRVWSKHTGGRSVVDPDVVFSSVNDFLFYLPRAIQLGLFSPLPNLWYGEASSSILTTGRMVIGFITLIGYVCLVGLVLVLWRNKGSLEVYLVVSYALFGILVFIYAYPNIGTFIRFRYGFYMILIGMGCSELMHWLRRYKA